MNREEIRIPISLRTPVGFDKKSLLKGYTDGCRYKPGAGGETNRFTESMFVSFSDNGLRAIKNIARSFPHAFQHYKNGHRNNSNLMLARSFTLDFDGKAGSRDWTFDQFKNSDFAKNTMWVAISSKSNTPETSCYHVLIPITHSFTQKTVNIYRHTLINIIEKHGIKCDMNALDASRYFSPSYASGEKVSENFFFEFHNGEIYNPSDSIEAVINKIESDRIEKEKKSAEHKKLIESYEKQLTKTRAVTEVSKKNLNSQAVAVITQFDMHPMMHNLKSEIAWSICKSLSIFERTAWRTAGIAIKSFAGESGSMLWETVCRNGSKFKESDLQEFDKLPGDMTGSIVHLMSIGMNNGWSFDTSLAERVVSIGDGLKPATQFCQDWSLDILMN